MKTTLNKKWLIIGCAALLIVLATIYCLLHTKNTSICGLDKDGNYYNTRWGMSYEDIKELIPYTPQLDDPSNLIYSFGESEGFANHTFNPAFRLEGDKLNLVIILIKSIDKSTIASEDVIDEYYQILSELYGKPTYNDNVSALEFNSKNSRIFYTELNENQAIIIEPKGE